MMYANENTLTKKLSFFAKKPNDKCHMCDTKHSGLNFFTTKVVIRKEKANQKIKVKLVIRKKNSCLTIKVAIITLLNFS